MHDALLIETHPDDVEEVKEITERNMLKAAQSIVGDYVRFGTDTTIGKRWGEV
jgi:DNA polymerase I-like protein with 3'-5' exonuclease and polymerase domains